MTISQLSLRPTVGRATIGARREGLGQVIHLSGEHDAATALDLSNELAIAVSLDHEDLVVDLSAVTFLSAATVGVLIRSRVFLDERGRHLRLVAPSSIARRVLDACKVTYDVERSSALASWVPVPATGGG